MKTTVRLTWSAAGLIALVVLHCQPADAQPPAADPPPDAPAGLGDPGSAEDVESLLDLADNDIAQLSRVDVTAPMMSEEVTTVSRQPSTVGKSPAAVFVITQEMIRRSGANNIPDVLRMVPGVEVARLDANKWAITARGFNNRYASKLLVQIDGRTVYDQSFAGVFWDALDVVLPDIERIEVIRGPGATVWGANAVNGVINIIRKNSKETQGPLVIAGTGTEEQGFSTLRYGGRVGEDLTWRAYGKQFERDGGFSEGGDEFDDWRQARCGFRGDWTPSSDDLVTLLGDYYTGESGNADVGAIPVPPFFENRRYDTSVFGQNYLMRWSHAIDADSDWSLQGYFDERSRLEEPVDTTQRTHDLDFQHRFALTERQKIIWGSGYRHIDDSLVGSFSLSLNRPHRSTNLYSAFVQDEIELQDDLWYLTIGSKFLHNDFTGFETQPALMVLCTPTDRQSLWASVSRAVRTPSRVDEGIVLNVPLAPPAPALVRFSGVEGIDSEELYAYEMGYRAQPTEAFSFDVAAYYNDYESLIGFRSLTPFFDPTLGALIFPTEFSNNVSADVYGAELASTYQFDPTWKVTGSYSLLYLDLHDAASNITQGSSPNNMMYVRSSWDLRNDLNLDLIGRYVDNLPVLGVSSYMTMDARLAWRPMENFEWAVVGRNLLDDRHLEFAEPFSGIPANEVESEVFTTITWTH